MKYICIAAAALGVIGALTVLLWSWAMVVWFICNFMVSCA